MVFREQGFLRMADDLSITNTPNGLSHEDLVALRDGGSATRPAGIPSSYDHGESIRWTPKDIADVHAMSRLGRYQIRGLHHRQPAHGRLE